MDRGVAPLCEATREGPTWAWAGAGACAMGAGEAAARAHACAGTHCSAMQAHALPSSFLLFPCPADALAAVHLPSSSSSVCLPAVICCLHLSLSPSHWLAGWLAAAPGSPRRASLAATQLLPLNRRHSLITGGKTPPSLLHGNPPANVQITHLPACLPLCVKLHASKVWIQATAPQHCI